MINMAIQSILLTVFAVLGSLVAGVFAIPAGAIVPAGNPTMAGAPGLGVPNIQVYSNQSTFMANLIKDNAKATGSRLFFSNNLNETLNLWGEVWADYDEPHLFFTNATRGSRDLSLPMKPNSFVRLNNIRDEFPSWHDEFSARWVVKRGCNNTLTCTDDNPGGAPWRTLGEVTWTGVNSANLAFWYNLGNVDGMNVAMQFIFLGNKTDCKPINMTDVDPRTYCPKPNLFDFKVNGTTQYGCASDCNIYQTDETCCRGEYKENFNKEGKSCPPSSEFFLKPYPELYSFAYDDKRGSRMCHGQEVDLLTNFGPPLSEERIAELKYQVAVDEEKDKVEEVHEDEDNEN